MKNQKNIEYFVGLDVGTNSVGYAASDPDYNMQKYQQHPMWGVHLFESANLAADRRTFRAARRRLDRRQQRIQLLRELFAKEIGCIDTKFFQRIDASSLKKEADDIPYAVFADKDYTDKEFYKRYPTIHHLISDLMESDEPHDVRLVYLACSWLLAHRGHFFSDVAKENIDEITDFASVYNDLTNFVEDHEKSFSWKFSEIDSRHIGEIIKSSKSRSDKFKELAEYLQVKKLKNAEENSGKWFDEYEFLRLLCGLECKSGKLFVDANYEDIKLSLDADDDKIAEMLSELNDEDASLILLAKKVFDWSVLADIIGSGKNLSDSKVQIYEKHKSDLQQLKYLVRKYLSRQDYNEIFRDIDKNNYVAYCGLEKRKKINREDFYKFLSGKLKNIQFEDIDDLEVISDKSVLKQIEQDIALEKFLPKQVTSDNRTIPYQLYWNELSNLLKKASTYLPFLLECDADGLSIKDKILSIMEFKIPYFVGPLNSHSEFAWIKRKADGRILPWNFDEKVDLDASEKAFIDRMTNKCTYLPGEAVLPKNSLLYQKFEVLNMINAIHVNGSPISVECKQKIYELFFKYSKVSKKTIVSCLISNNFYSDISVADITGIDDTITASLSSWKIFKPLLEAKKLTGRAVEAIINQRAFTEDKKRFCTYLRTFPLLDNEDIKWISSKKLQGFGRLSEKFLTAPAHWDLEIGEKSSIINMMWNHNLNLQQLLSDDYSFAKMVENARKEYYSQKPQSLTERLDEMYISNAVKRPIIRTLTVLQEVVETVGNAPKKIFVEMARDVDNSGKGKRTVSRFAQLQKLYQEIADEDTRRLSKELEKYDESALQRDVLYLYFMQLGKDMYTDDPIADLALCNKEHIYPQSKVKDDSILNNIVLVNSKLNGEKSDTYPVDAEIRRKMTPFWQELLEKKLITPEKFHRLTRSTPFSDDEKWGFINRQLVETRQATKVITELIKERYPDSEVVYVKAGLVSDFRHEFDLVKSRTLNDLHHAKDAYLNIVVGNVYHSKFTRQWFLDNSNTHYSVKTENLFSDMVEIRKTENRKEIIWHKEYEHIAKNLQRNYIHLTNYAFCRHGGLFNQNPLSAASGLIPRKKGLSTEIYGGYDSSTITFFTLALIEEIKNRAKKQLTLIPVNLLSCDDFLNDKIFAVNYVKNFVDQFDKKNLDIKFPLGLKPIKLRTVFEVDNGLRFVLQSYAGKGELSISYCSPLLLNSDWEKYIKRLESFCEKKKSNSNIIFCEKYDKFTCTENIKIYDILIEKLRSGIFAKRRKNPLEILEKGREKFVSLQPHEQAEILLAIIYSFGKGCVNGVNTEIIGGNKAMSKTRISSNLANWNYQTAHIVYSDASGLHETKSINLLDLI